MAVMKLASYGRPVRTGHEARLLSLLVLGLLAAGLVLGGLLRPPAASTGRQPASAPAPSGAQTYRQPAQDGSSIALEQAVASVRRFAGRPDLALVGGLEPGVGRDGGASYALEPARPAPTASGAAEPNRADERYRVDARSGEVLEATLPTPAGGAGAGSALSSVQAEQRAERFAAERFFGFAGLALVDRSVVPAANGQQFYVYKWAALAPESGAELPTSVLVSVSAGDGRVVWYLAHRDSADVDPRPLVPREIAVATAAGLVEPAGRWDTRAPSSVRLQVVYAEGNEQRLAWAVTFAGRPDAPAPGRANLRLLIDARTDAPIPSL